LPKHSAQSSFGAGWQAGRLRGTGSFVWRDLFDLAWGTAARLKRRALGRDLSTEPRAVGAILAHAGHEGLRILRRRPGVLVLSYPKSGRTWLRFMLDNLGTHLAYTHFETGVPPDWADQRIMFLHRDPRDVLVSRWFARRFRTNLGEIALADLLHDADDGLAAIAEFNLLWAERVRQRKGVVVSYEALLADAGDGLQRLLGWLGVERSDEAIRRAVEAGHFDRMREVEASGRGARLYGFALAPGDPRRPETFKTRRGGSGAWREHFSEAQARFADDLLAERNYFARMGSDP
jgi:hypothetical protein